MIRELIEAWRTPTSAIARKLGYLYESIAMRERHRRCGDSWDFHLQRCHRAMELAVSSCPGETLAIFGSGLLVEVPMDHLLLRFSKIILVDLVHPRQVRQKWSGHSNVELLEQDLLGVADELVAWRPGSPLPTPRPPDLSFLNAHFVISANCLSQLALRPRQYLESVDYRLQNSELDAYCRKLSHAHLKMIRGLNRPHLLIADFETRAYDQTGLLVEKAHPFYDLKDLRMKEEWIWKIAPRGELSPSHDVEMSVGAFTLEASSPSAFPGLSDQSRKIGSHQGS